MFMFYDFIFFLPTAPALKRDQLATGDWRLPTAYFFTFRLSPNPFNDLNKKISCSKNRRFPNKISKVLFLINLQVQQFPKE